MPNLIATCYGRYCDQLDQCEMCQERPWCRDAADPRPLNTGQAAGEAYEAAQREPHQPERHDPGATTEFSQAMRRIIVLCGGNPARIGAVLLRLAGWSFDAIGDSFRLVSVGKSRQAAWKDLQRVVADNPELAKLLRKRFDRPTVAPTVTAALVAAFAERRPLWRGPVKGPTGIYAMLAVEFGLSSWHAAASRLRRAGVRVDKRRHSVTQKQQQGHAP